MLFKITNRWTGSVQCEVEIDASFESRPVRVQLGAAVKVAYSTGAVLRGADLTDADLRDADLTDADLRGADLRGADLRDADLTDAVLTGAVLRGADLTDAVLTGAVLRGADLTDADLRDADLRDADLRGADLRDAVLTDADLRGAFNEDIAVPSLHRKILAAIDAGGELDMSNWHTCDTTHCRAGWAIHLAGAPGRVLEACLGPSVAGALIHLASCPQLEGKVPDFHASDENALADIKRLAELEPAIA